MSKRKLHENPATLSYKGTLQLSTPSHTTENLTEIQQVKIEVVNVSDSGSARSTESELTVQWKIIEKY